MSMHPTVVERLVEQMHDLSNIIDSADADLFTNPAVRAAGERLLDGLEAADRAAARVAQPDCVATDNAQAHNRQR